MTRIPSNELEFLLEEAYDRYARPEFIQDDPIQMPRSFAQRADAEVIGFLTATIAWGQRGTIIKNAQRLVKLLEEEPHTFVMSASEDELRTVEHFVHRTFNGLDLIYFLKALRNLYEQYGGLEQAFLHEGDPADMRTLIADFRSRFFSIAPADRTGKHVANPVSGSSAKRINMFLRWMVRKCDRGIDLGLWQQFDPKHLHVPLDVHTGAIGRELGLLSRKQNDWKAVTELTQALRQFDAVDPIRFDLALFGLGAYSGAAIN